MYSVLTEFICKPISLDVTSIVGLRKGVWSSDRTFYLVKHDNTIYNISIPHRLSREQGSSPAISSQVAVEKSATENKTNKKTQLIKASTKTTIITLNTANIWKIPELIDSVVRTGQDVICLQEHRFIHENTLIKEHTFDKWKLITCSAWRNNRRC